MCFNQSRGTFRSGRHAPQIREPPTPWPWRSRTGGCLVPMPQTINISTDRTALSGLGFRIAHRRLADARHSPPRYADALPRDRPGWFVGRLEEEDFSTGHRAVGRWRSEKRAMGDRGHRTGLEGRRSWTPRRRCSVHRWRPDPRAQPASDSDKRVPATPKVADTAGPTLPRPERDSRATPGSARGSSPARAGSLRAARTPSAGG